MDAFNDKDKVLVSYLFNELSETETREFEDEMLLDDELFERLPVVEMILIDNYVRGEMNAAERSRFEEKFLARPEKREQVNHARMFHQSLQRLHERQPIVSPADARKQGWLQQLAGLFFRPLPVLVLTALALFFAFAAFYVLAPRSESPVNQQSEVTPSSTTVTVPGNVNGVVRSEPDNSATVKPIPPPAKSPRSIAHNKAPQSSPSELARNEPDKYTRSVCLFCQDQPSVERSGGNPLPITLNKKTTHLRLIYELLDEIPRRETFVVTIKNRYNDPIDLKNGASTQEIRPVQKGKRQKRRFIILSIPIRSFKDSGPYTFEIDEPNFSPASFTITK